MHVDRALDRLLGIGVMPEEVFVGVDLDGGLPLPAFAVLLRKDGVETLAQTGDGVAEVGDVAFDDQRLGTVRAGLGAFCEPLSRPQNPPLQSLGQLRTSHQPFTSSPLWAQWKWAMCGPSLLPKEPHDFSPGRVLNVRSGSSGDHSTCSWWRRTIPSSHPVGAGPPRLRPGGSPGSARESWEAGTRPGEAWWTTFASQTSQYVCHSTRV